MRVMALCVLSQHPHSGSQRLMRRVIGLRWPRLDHQVGHPPAKAGSKHRDTRHGGVPLKKQTAHSFGSAPFLFRVRQQVGLLRIIRAEHLDHQIAHR